MSKRPGPFRKIDVTRFVEAVRAGGVVIGRVEFADGKISVVTASEAAEPHSELDAWMAKNAR